MVTTTTKCSTPSLTNSKPSTSPKPLTTIPTLPPDATKKGNNNSSRGRALPARSAPSGSAGGGTSILSDECLPDGESFGWGIKDGRNRARSPFCNEPGQRPWNSNRQRSRERISQEDQTRKLLNKLLEQLKVGDIFTTREEKEILVKWMKHITKAGVEPTNDEADDQRNQEYGKGMIAAELGADKPPINVNVEVDIKLEEARMRGIPCKAPPIKAPPTDPKYRYKAPPGFPPTTIAGPPPGNLRPGRIISPNECDVKEMSDRDKAGIMEIVETIERMARRHENTKMIVPRNNRRPLSHSIDLHANRNNVPTMVRE